MKKKKATYYVINPMNHQGYNELKAAQDAAMDLFSDIAETLPPREIQELEIVQVIHTGTLMPPKRRTVNWKRN